MMCGHRKDTSHALCTASKNNRANTRMSTHQSDRVCAMRKDVTVNWIVESQRSKGDERQHDVIE
eukprot:scaffold25196_cov211-Skeletonema_dohrnii-CCMP3373.AAC.1